MWYTLVNVVNRCSGTVQQSRTEGTTGQDNLSVYFVLCHRQVCALSAEWRRTSTRKKDTCTYLCMEKKNPSAYIYIRNLKPVSRFAQEIEPATDRRRYRLSSYYCKEAAVSSTGAPGNILLLCR